MMIKEDIQQYKIDFTGVDMFNNITREHMSRTSDKKDTIAIPRHAPFYIKSVKLYNIDGTKLDEGTDYEFYGILGRLTAYTAMPVGLFIKIKNPDLMEWYIDYQVVGNFNKITNEILNLLKSAYEDDRLVNWENITNKPTWFVPTVHQHDLVYDIYGFTDLAQELLRIAELRGTVSRPETVTIDALKGRLTRYIEGYREVIKGLIDSHAGGKVNNHGVWKTNIGLDKVDDYRVATLEEAIEGLSEELHLTPYIAAQAVSKAAGKNNKLFPSGSLPILRYGADSFIPPTITGSFEGMGGFGQRCGAIVESDGTLLVLSRRMNGVTKGLYFIRSINYMNKVPTWEFTAYRYTHPQATKDGANLNQIVNGSNRYMMIVGDEDKNIWYWVATNGTFDPSRHTLNRMSGDWVEFIKSHPSTDFLNKPVNDCTLLANEDFMTRAVILQGMSEKNAREVRPSWMPPYGDGVEFPKDWTRHFDGFCFYQMNNANGKFTRSKVNFKHPKWGNANDDLFSPFILERVIVDNKAMVKSYHAEFDTPCEVIWTFRAIHARTAKLDTDITALRMEFMILSISKDGVRADWRTAYRAQLVYGMEGSKPTVQVLPVTGSDRLYNVDPNNLYDVSTPDRKLFKQYVHTTATPENQDIVGSADLYNGYMIFLGGSSNWAFPNTFGISGQSYLKSPAAVIEPPPTPPEEEWKTFTSFNQTMLELNPAGLGTLFVSQAHMCTDTDNHTSGAMMARQVGPKGSEWVVRPTNTMDEEWKHTQPDQSSIVGGKLVKHYPLTAKVYKTNIGPQVSLCNPVILPGISGKYRYNKIFGADAWSTLLGEPIGISDAQGNGRNKDAVGDGLWIKENKIKMVNDIVTFTPVIVYSLTNTIKTQVKKWLADNGTPFAGKFLENTWGLGRVVLPNGKWLEIFTAFQIVDRRCMATTFICEITPKGSPVIKDDYQFYADCTFNFKTPPVTVQMGDSTVEQLQQGPDFVFDVHQHNPVSISIPYKEALGANKFDTTSMSLLPRSMARYVDIRNRQSYGLVLKLDTSDQNNLKWSTVDGKPQIENVFSTDNGPDGGWISTPAFGIGYGKSGTELMEGAGLVSARFDDTGDVWSNIAYYKLAKTPQGELDLILGVSNLLVSQYVVYFNKIDNVIIAGKGYNMASTFIDIKAIDPTPANKTFYCYLRFSNGQADYEITQNVYPETSVRSMLAIIKCGPTQIETIQAFNRFSMDGAVVSSVRRGSSILAASGSVFEIGDTSTIMLDSDLIP